MSPLPLLFERARSTRIEAGPVGPITSQETREIVSSGAGEIVGKCGCDCFRCDSGFLREELEQRFSELIQWNAMLAFEPRKEPVAESKESGRWRDR